MLIFSVFMGWTEQNGSLDLNKCLIWTSNGASILVKLID